MKYLNNIYVIITVWIIILSIISFLLYLLAKWLVDKVLVEEKGYSDWISIKDRPLTFKDGEVIAYHKNWEDEDFNPEGTRAGFTDDEGKFISAKWCGFCYKYESCNKVFPTKYFIIPKI